MQKFIKLHWQNILFIAFIVLLFTPLGLPIRVVLIKTVSLVRTNILPIEESNTVNIDFQRSEAYKLIDPQGNVIDVSRVKNKVLIINYWATWCPPCIAEMPSFQELYHKYKNNRNYMFLFIAQDSPERVEKFIKKNDYDLPVYFERSPPPERLKSESLPTTYILNKRGEVVVHKTGALDWNSKRIIRILDQL